MRKTIIPVVMILLVVCGIAFAQQPKVMPQEPRTKLESFGKQAGTVVIKGFSEIGTVGGMGSVSVEAMEFTDASTGKRQTGIIMEVKESGRLERSDRSFIDYEEIEPLMKGIDYIAKVKPEVTKLGNFEAIYKTKGDFSVITYSNNGKVDVAVKSGYIGVVTAYLSLEDLTELRGLISGAKQKLDSLQ